MNFPGSPYFVLERLLEEYRSGRRSEEDAFRSLDIFDMFLDQWSEGLDALPQAPEILPEGEAKVETSFQGLDLFGEAAECLRNYLETGDEEQAESAMELARQGHHLLEQLYLQTAQQVEDLRNEVG